MSVSASDPQTRHGQAPHVRTAVVFDVDGTLLDTNYLHVTAWW